MSTRKLLFWILLVSVLARLASAIYMGDQVVELPGTQDQISYHTLAQRVLNGHGFTFDSPWWPITPAGAPTAHWSFLYTFYLVAVYALFGPHPLAARLIQAVIVGLLQPYLTYRLGRRIFNEQTGLIAAALVAVYAYFIYYAGALMTEPFYIIAILGALDLAILFTDAVIAAPADLSLNRSQVFRLVGFGLTFGAAVLLRQLFLALLPILLLWMLWRVRRRNWLAQAVRLAIPVAVVAAMILPFSIYNYQRFGKFVLLNTNAGYAFFWGNHPIYGTRFLGILPPEMGTYQQLIPDGLRHLDEADLEKALMRRGLQFVLDDPGRYILLSLSRIPVYFQFWPSPESGLISNLSRVLSFGLLWPLMLYGLLRAYRDGPARSLDEPAWLLLLFALSYTGIHLLSWTLIRYRLPVDAVLLVFAGCALLDLYRRLRPWLVHPTLKAGHL